MSRISANENLTRLFRDFVRAIARSFYMSYTAQTGSLWYNARLCDAKIESATHPKRLIKLALI